MAFAFRFDITSTLTGVGYRKLMICVNTQFFFESLILAQDERWRRALGMQVERSGDSARGYRTVADG